jgi:hypothetical protein
MRFAINLRILYCLLSVNVILSPPVIRICVRSALIFVHRAPRLLVLVGVARQFAGRLGVKSISRSITRCGDLTLPEVIYENRTLARNPFAEMSDLTTGISHNRAVGTPLTERPCP